MSDVFARLASFADIKKSNKSQKCREKASFDQEVAIADSHGDAVELVNPLTSFSLLRSLKPESNNLEWLIESLNDKLGLEMPSPVQRSVCFTCVFHNHAQVIPLAFQGKDIVAVAPTGSGKTLAYLTCLLLSHKVWTTSSEFMFWQKQEAIQSLILVPTVELVNQVKKELVFLIGRFISQRLYISQGITMLTFCRWSADARYSQLKFAYLHQEL